MFLGFLNVNVWWRWNEDKNWRLRMKPGQAYLLKLPNLKHEIPHSIQNTKEWIFCVYKYDFFSGSTKRLFTFCFVESHHDVFFFGKGMIYRQAIKDQPSSDKLVLILLLILNKFAVVVFIRDIKTIHQCLDFSFLWYRWCNKKLS